jgi:hypothetical protein
MRTSFPAVEAKEHKGDDMARHGAEGAQFHITIPDPDDRTMLHAFSVDPENEEALGRLWYRLIKQYGEEGEEIAAQALGPKALSRAICGVLVSKGRLIRRGDGLYAIPK